MKTNECRGFKLPRLSAFAMVLVCGLMVVRAAPVTNAQSGPEIKSFLDFMRHEEDELEFQIGHGEITRKEYVRSKHRIAIHRQTVLSLMEETGHLQMLYGGHALQVAHKRGFLRYLFSVWRRAPRVVP